MCEDSQYHNGISCDVNIEELLNRQAVIFDTLKLEQVFKEKVVLVTGGGGSIGSELCRQVAMMKPSMIIILDNYENNAYDIQQELLYIYHDNLQLQVEIASIQNWDKMKLIFQKYHPDIVFHAAAHKHVPLMERCPDEAIRNNVFGTYNLIMASHMYQVERFVLISSDKAVNPTNIMGATKCMCEMMIRSMKEVSKTEYMAVRFGNVLGSNGSVIPLFKKQIEAGGPVTVTDKRIVRYFMTMTEAAQLVLQACFMANKSEIYVLDMGEPIKIIQLAETMIRQSGCIPYEEIQIEEVGLRPGEKLYEEIVGSRDNLIATDNKKIFMERQCSITPMELEEKINTLVYALDTKSGDVIKNALKKVVPTYKEPEEVNGAVYEEIV